MALSKDPVKRDAQVIHFKASKAGMTEPEYRDWLHEQFGVYSASQLAYRQRRIAHAHLNRLLDAAPNPQLAKLTALWHALAEHGEVRDRSRTALEHWCQRQQPGLRALQWASSYQMQTLIEALKLWARRADVPLE